jgi:hypothetical protein
MNLGTVERGQAHLPTELYYITPAFPTEHYQQRRLLQFQYLQLFKSAPGGALFRIRSTIFGA